MAVNYIFEHYMRELPLEEVASHLGMKPTYSRFFKRATGRCYVEFVNSLRISKSCELLLDQDSRLPTSASSRASTTCSISIAAFSSSRA